MSNIANGDMVTLTLVQRVLNTFVVFLARIVGFFVDRTMFRSDDDQRIGPGFYATVFVCEVVFGFTVQAVFPKS